LCANELAIRRTFEAAGVEFTNGDQPGIRLIKADAPIGAPVSSSRSGRAAKVGRGGIAKGKAPKR